MEDGEYARFAKNPHWRGGDLAADEVVLRFFKSADAMYQALMAGEIDYAHNVTAEQFKLLERRPEHRSRCRLGKRLHRARLQCLCEGDQEGWCKYHRTARPALPRCTWLRH